MTPKIKVGDKIPSGSFLCIPWGPELEDNSACGKPITLTTDVDFKGKRVVIFSVPGAFTPTCHVSHLPGFIQKYDEIKAKGVDIIAVLASNDAFVMSGWGRFEGLKEKIITLSDTNAEWSASLGLSLDLTARGMGIRTARYGLILDDLVVKYVDVEPGAEVTVSGADAILAAL